MAKRPSIDSVASSKRFRAAIDESIDDLVCPITQALPLDPVFAEDGKVYERHAIEEWLTKQERSPVTNLPMGTRVFAATQIKSLIERMVKTDALPEDKVSDWKRRIQQQERVEKTRRAADAGDAASALNLASWLSEGANGLAKDDVKAFEYLKQAAEAGSAAAMAHVSHKYYYGNGVQESDGLALRWAAAAAALNQGTGMTILADLYRRGAAGLPKDEGKAFKWQAKAGQLGALNSKGLVRLGFNYSEGRGTTVDMAMAEAMMRKAIAKNNQDTAVGQARAWLASHGLPI